jgi:nucleoside transporter
MPPLIRLHLSVLFFLQFFIWGTWGVSMGSWMGQLGFSATQIGNAFGATSIAAMISPFFVGAIADRFFQAQRLLGTLHVVGGLALAAAGCTKTYGAFFPLLLVHTLCYMPTLALANTVAFAQMQDAAKGFGSIRLMGTFGWIAAGLVIGTLNLGTQSTQFFIGAAVSVALGLYAWLLIPAVPPKSRGVPLNLGAMIGLDALPMLRERSFAVFALGSCLICIPLAFYYSGAERFLTQVGVEQAPAKMTLGQASEVLFMVVFPWMFTRLGVKRMLLLGMASWVARYLCFAQGAAGGASATALLLAGIVLHGPCFDFFFVTGQVYVDRCAPAGIRAAAQSFIAFLTYGLGMYIGSLTQGMMLDRFTAEGGKIDWAPTWIYPAVGSAVVLLMFALFFRDSTQRAAQEKSA